MKKLIRILYLEDSPEDVELIKDLLAREYLPCEVTWVSGREAFRSALRDRWHFDLLLVDYALPDIGGEEALELAKEAAPDLPFVYLSGSLGEERAVECLRQGATDYVLKTNLPRLAPVVRRALVEAQQAAARREAEASHGRVAALLRATLESTAEGILVVDLAGRISAYNRKFLTLFGIPEFVMAPMEMDQVVQYLTGQFADPDTLLEEARLLRARSDKESSGILPLVGDRFLEKTGRPHRVGGETVGRVLAFREPQVREAPGELLKAIGSGRQAFSEALLAAKVVPWYLLEDRLVLPAEAGAAVLGMAPPEDLKALVDRFHPEDAQLLMEALERGRNVSFKARLRRPDGSWRWLRWNVDRGPEGYRGVFMDVAEQEWLQERALQRRHSEGARDLARRLAGKLQEPVRRAVAELRSLTLPEDEAKPLQEALGALQEAEQLLSQVRAFAHLGRPACVRVHPNAFLEAFLGFQRATAGPDLQIRFEPAPDLPNLNLDPAQVELALTALFLNARQAMAGRGVLRVATSLMGPRDHRRGALPGAPRHRVVIQIQDTGPGIPPGLHRQVFEPFVTTELSAGRPGLGLAIVREIITAHGGSVQLESAPGSGTTVRLLFPV